KVRKGGIAEVDGFFHVEFNRFLKQFSNEAKLAKRF
ncbi:hypothetical protein ACISNR_09340, partial [Campylobacter jejuni]